MQIEKLQLEGCDKIIEEKFTGIKLEKPKFSKVLKELKEDDTLVVNKLDRLVRNVKEGIDVFEELFKKNVRVHVLNVGLLENTTMGRYFLQTMLAGAEMERDMIVERTQEGKASAKKREDFRDGRPKKFKKAQIDHALKLLETNSYMQVEEITGISKSTY